MELQPRRWWTGVLDVERFAWESVRRAQAATQAVADARGQAWRVGTDAALVAASFAAIEHLRVDGRTPQGWAPLSGFYPTADGWVRLHANYPHHAAALAQALGASERTGVEAALLGMTSAEAEDAVTTERGIAAAVRTPEQWAAHPHGAATASDPWWTTERLVGRPALRGGALPLDGVRVLDLTRVIAGPTCGQLLACLGADVLRLDRPDRPELLDQYLSNGQGKRSAEADLGVAADDLRALLAAADVVLLGYRPGSLDRFGLAPEALTDRYPGLVIGSLSAWGERGPWARRPGFDSIVQAASGIATTCAPAGSGKPGALPVQALDHATGYQLAAEVLGLLAEAHGGIVRISLLGAARTLLGYPAPPEVLPAELDIPRVRLESPHGVLDAVPPPLTLDGRTLERPVGGYGQSRLAWTR